jgi:hypothetical protein
MPGSTRVERLEVAKHIVEDGRIKSYVERLHSALTNRTPAEYVATFLAWYWYQDQDSGNMVT